MRYFIKTASQVEKEVDKATYIEFEREAGFHSKFGPDEIATESFYGGGISGRVDREYESKTPAGINHDAAFNQSAFRKFMTEAHNYASVKFDNATYIQRELANANIKMPDAIRAQAEYVCEAFTDTNQDIISELSDMNGLLSSAVSATDFYSRTDRIMKRFGDDIRRMNQLVNDLETASKENPVEYGLAYMLISESATNILNAFNRTGKATDSMREGKKS
jgi:hypothetical protein